MIFVNLTRTLTHKHPVSCLHLRKLILCSVQMPQEPRARRRLYGNSASNLRQQLHNDFLFLLFFFHGSAFHTFRRREKKTPQMTPAAAAAAAGLAWRWQPPQQTEGVEFERRSGLLKSCIGKKRKKVFFGGELGTKSQRVCSVLH